MTPGSCFLLRPFQVEAAAAAVPSGRGGAQKAEPGVAAAGFLEEGSPSLWAEVTLLVSWGYCHNQH